MPLAACAGAGTALVLAAVTSKTSMTPMPSPGSRPRPLFDCLVIVLACVPIYWLWLGASGFSASEGHRVAPAWEILRTGDWMVTRMFEQVYVRKPPGMPWAIAVATRLLGHTEFAARSISALAATLAPLVTFAYASLWFGRRRGGDGESNGKPDHAAPVAPEGGPSGSDSRGVRSWAPLGAGLVHVFTPLFWSPGRSAEIESLHSLGVQLAALALVDLIIGGPLSRGRVMVNAIGVLAGVVLAGLCKGPAGAPILIGVFAGACLAARSLRPLAKPAAYVPIFLAIGVLVWIGLIIARKLAALDEPVIAQNPGEFLWDSSRILQTLTLAPAAFIAALPSSLALLFPWGPDARRELAPSPAGFLIARTLAWAWIASVGLETLIGVSNPRYVAPAAALLPALAGYVFAGGFAQGREGVRRFTPLRSRIARVLVLGHPAVAVIAFLIGGTIFARLTTQRRDEDSGRRFGREIASTVQGPCEIFANHAVEARPEILLEARHAAAGVGVVLRPRWVVPTLEALPLRTSARDARYLLLRLDSGSDEARFVGTLADSLAERLRGRVGPYEFGLFQVIDPQSGDDQSLNGEN